MNREATTGNEAGACRPNPSDSFERERSGHVLRWSRIAPAREELRNASNKNEHEPTSDHSTNYGNGHLIRVFRDIGRIFLSPCPFIDGSASWSL